MGLQSQNAAQDPEGKVLPKFAGWKGFFAAGLSVVLFTGITGAACDPGAPAGSACVAPRKAVVFDMDGTISEDLVAPWAMRSGTPEIFQAYQDKGYEVILIGHAGHPEVEGTMGRINGPVHLISGAHEVADLRPANPDKLAFVTQTTLSVDDTRAIIAALSRRFRDLVGPETRDICYATQNRQAAVRALAEVADLILVVGARNSSNCNRLREIAAEAGRPSHLVEGAEDLAGIDLGAARTLGLTAGASTPEVVIAEVIAALQRRTPLRISTLPGIIESASFPLPSSLGHT